MKKLFKAIYNFMRTKTDLEITVIALAQCLYSRGLNSFSDMSEHGQIYWIEKTSNSNLGLLVDEELKRGKTDKKWVKNVIKSAKNYSWVNDLKV
jgi:hypothetical protein